MSAHTPRENSPLLGQTNGNATAAESFSVRALRAIKAEGEPGWLASYRFFFFGSWLNILLVFVPLSFLSHLLDWDAALRFTFSFIAIMPLAKACSSLKKTQYLTDGLRHG